MQEGFKSFIGEEWKEVDLDCPYVKEGYAIEVSNFGRICSITSQFGRRLLKGDQINGYKIVRLKFFKPRLPENQEKLEEFILEINFLKKESKRLKAEGPVEKFNETQEQLEKLTHKKDKFLRKETLARTINQHYLIHRLVAEYFLPKPDYENGVVAHLDFNKYNNKYTNLKWMTLEENLQHQQKSPFVISDLKKRKNRFFPSDKNSKLTETKVMYLKKLLNEGKPMKQLVRQFKVTETQILRIKRGENWGRVKAAK